MASPINWVQERTATSSERARIIEINNQDADEVLDALSADTRRAAFRFLFDEPGTASELADRLDTSIQNAHYHLSTLQKVGLIEAIDTTYTEKGNEMTIYGPASDPLVFVGDGDRTSHIEQSLTGTIGGLAALAVASLLVQWGAETLVRGSVTAPSVVGPASYGPATSTAGTLAWLVFDVLEPGIVFFAGCLLVAAIATFLTKR